jgi:hypothetical protein
VDLNFNAANNWHFLPACLFQDLRVFDNYSSCKLRPRRTVIYRSNNVHAGLDAAPSPKSKIPLFICCPSRNLSAVPDSQNFRSPVEWPHRDTASQSLPLSFPHLSQPITTARAPFLRIEQGGPSTSPSVPELSRLSCP